MRLSIALRNTIVAAVAWIAPFCPHAQGQDPRGASPQAKESPGLPPRATPGDYQAQGKAGDVTIGAEFVGHSAATPDATYTTEDYIVIETGLFGSPGSRVQLSLDNFSLRVNGKKSPLTSQSYESVFHSLKDPEWEPPAAAKSKGGISSGGQGGGDSTPAVVHMPMDLRLKMEQRVKSASLPAGDRALPQAGLLFFLYHGKIESLRSLELIYSGPAGTATLNLQP